MVLFQDDDTIINEIELEKFLKKPWGNPSTPYCLGGLYIYNHGVVRPGNKKWAKWAVSKEVYNLNFYPPYCSGACYLTSSAYATKIAETAKITNPNEFPHEDGIFTGILRLKAGISLPTKVRGPFNGTVCSRTAIINKSM